MVRTISRNALIATVALFVAGTCPYAQQQTAKERTNESQAETVTVCELLQNPNSYSGKLVRVRGVYTYGFELSKLETTECCSKTVGIWFQIEDDLDPTSAKKLATAPKGMGSALGTFVGEFATHGPYGHLGMPYQLRLRSVEKIERSSRPSDGKNPNWIPGNCPKD